MIPNMTEEDAEQEGWRSDFWEITSLWTCRLLMQIVWTLTGRAKQMGKCWGYTDCSQLTVHVCIQGETSVLVLYNLRRYYHCTFRFRLDFPKSELWANGCKYTCRFCFGFFWWIKWLEMTPPFLRLHIGWLHRTYGLLPKVRNISSPSACSVEMQLMEDELEC